MRAASHPSGRSTGLVEAWGELVGQIEEGYDDVINEYWNDLSVRDLLEELLAVIPKGQRPYQPRPSTPASKLGALQP